MPVPINGIQSNTCRNAACSNFGVEPLLNVTRGRAPKGKERVGDNYIIVGSSKSDPRRSARKSLYCKLCGESASLKSNVAVQEEFERLSAYLDPDPSPSCQTQTCSSFRLSVAKHPKLYYTHGKTPFDTSRWRCKACKSTFSEHVIRQRPQQKSYENRTVFKALINKNSIKAMSRIAEISPQTVYDKIDFIHRQCVAFVREREQKMHRKNFGHRYISVDRQDYVINWSDRKDRRPTQLTAVASADNRAGYVYGMHLNFDPGVDLQTVEFKAIQAGDFDGRETAFRRYARYWMEPDLEARKAGEKNLAPEVRNGKIFNLVVDRERENSSMEDPEDKELFRGLNPKLPTRGAQVHFVYTVHGHFRLLERLLAGTAKVRFFMDQDETLRAACISAFAWRIKEARADAFYVGINKNVGIDTKRQLVAESKETFDKFRAEFGRPDWPDHRVRLYLIRAALPQMIKRRGFRDAWLMYPQYTMNEPGKAVAYLTDRGDYGLDHLAALYNRATMHAVDRYFMQIRRLLSMLERPIPSRSSSATWSGYSPYNPAIIQKLLDIFRVHYNYCKAEDPRKDRKGNPLPRRTPAMKLGLAKGLVRIEDILYFGRDDARETTESR